MSAAYDAAEWSDLFVRLGRGDGGAVRPAVRGGDRAGRASRCAATAPWRAPPDRFLAPAVAGAQPDRGGGCGLYWVLAGVVAAIASAATNAWVLLIEILR